MKDSTGFMFNEVHSSALGVVNVHDSNGLYSDNLHFTHDIQEKSQLNGMVISTKEVIQPISFSMTIFFDQINNSSIGVREIIRWLKTNEFKPMTFDNYPNMVIYAKAKTFSSVQHNGLNQGLLTVEFITNSGYIFSQPELSSIIHVKDEPVNLVLNNDGDALIYPRIWIEKEEKGDIQITNKTTEEILKIENLNNKEKIFIDGERKLLTSDQEMVGNYRGNDHNRVWLSLERGIFDGANELVIEGKGRFQFEIQYKFFALANE